MSEEFTVERVQQWVALNCVGLEGYCEGYEDFARELDLPL